MESGKDIFIGWITYKTGITGTLVGHRIPVWYRKGKVKPILQLACFGIGPSDPAEQDEDVLDAGIILALAFGYLGFARPKMERQD